MAVTPLSSGMWGGKLTMATDAAKAGAATAAGIAKLKAKQDKEDTDAYNAVMKSITPTKGLHRLLQKPAAELYGSAVMDILKRKQSGSPNWINEAAQVGADYVEAAANLTQISDNYKGFVKAVENPSLFHSKKHRDLYEKMTRADRIEKFKSTLGPESASIIDPNNLTIDYNKITSTPRRDVNKELASSFNQITPLEGKNIIKQGDKEFREQVILPTDEDAKQWAKLNGVDPNNVFSLESTVRDRFMTDRPFLEQYVDQKGLDLGAETVYDMSPETAKKIQDALIKDGTPFLETKYKNIGGFKIYNSTGGDKEAPYVYNKGVYGLTAVQNIGGKNVEKPIIGFSAIRPIDKTKQNIQVIRGTVDRNFNVVKNKQQNVDVAITGLTILPYSMKDGLPQPQFGNEITTDSKFDIYYEFDNGTYAPKSNSSSQLQFNLGGKDPVARQQEAMDKMEAFNNQLNEYQKLMRTIKKQNPNYKPELYTQLENYQAGKITPSDFNNFIKNFDFKK